MGPYHILGVEVDGLNLDTEVFNYKSRLCFSHPKDADENISSATVFMNKPMSLPEGGPSWEPQNLQRSQDSEEMLQMVGLFIACYGLQNNRALEIVFNNPSGMSFTNLEELPKLLENGMGHHIWIKSNKKKLTVEKTLASLHNTIPLFKKILSIIETSERKIDPLKIALLVYQRAILKKEILQDFISLVTVIEALLCDKEDLSYKFAMRTTLLIEPDLEKREELFKLLRKTYRARSDLVHGSDMSMFPYATYMELKEKLEKISKKVLFNYAELASKKMNNNSIKNYLDKIALNNSRS